MSPEKLALECGLVARSWTVCRMSQGSRLQFEFFACEVSIEAFWWKAWRRSKKAAVRGVLIALSPARLSQQLWTILHGHVQAGSELRSAKA